MSFLEIDLDDVSNAVEPKPVENGEYELRLIELREGTDKNGKPYLLPKFEIPSEPDAPDFSKFLRLPCSDLSEKELSRARYALKTFFECFGIDYGRDGVDLDAAVGLTGWAILGTETDEEYGDKNFVRKFIVGA